MTAVMPTCAPPIPKIGRRSSTSFVHENVRPRENISRITPSSPKAPNAAPSSCSNPRTCGPNTSPVSRNPRIAGTPSRTESDTTTKAPPIRSAALSSIGVAFDALSILVSPCDLPSRRSGHRRPTGDGECFCHPASRLHVSTAPPAFAMRRRRNPSKSINPPKISA